MASQPDAHPDSEPTGPSDSPEQVSPATDPGRETVEDSPGDFASMAGTGGETKVQDQSFER
jgi:hypothetical protein